MVQPGYVNLKDAATYIGALHPRIVSVAVQAGELRSYRNRVLGDPQALPDVAMKGHI